MQTIFNFTTNEIEKNNDMAIIILNKVKIRIIFYSKDYKL